MNIEHENSDRDGAADSDALTQGQLVRHYQIVRNLASGGTGQVYLAHDTKLGRQVALKFLHASSPDSQSREPILKEARAAAQLNHPNVVSVHSLEEFNGRWFVALEYVDGRTLQEELTNGPIEPSRLLDIARQLCEGLAAAHELGIVHRDLKPANVLITSKGVAKIADFGVATTPDRGMDADEKSSAGTLAYMSPELVLGGTIDSRSDLFSLGALLYELATGRRPFQGGYRASLEYSILNDTPESITRICPGAPPELVKIIERLLEKSPDARYQTAADVATDLMMTGAMKSTTSDPSTLRPRVRPLTFFLAGVALVLAGYWIVQEFVTAPSTPSTSHRLRVAVLPFENLGRRDDEYFSDGITDAITTHLVSLRDLAVISRTSAMQYKHTDKSIPEIGAELQVDFLLTGTLLWERADDSNHVIISPQLIRASDDTYVWTESYDRVIETLFVVQSDIAAKVAHALNVNILDPERDRLSQPPTDNLVAYDKFLRGQASFYRSWQKPDLEAAAEMFTLATQLDSSFALAYAMLARAHASLYHEYYDRTPERLEQAVGATERAIRLQPNLPESHIARGYLFYHGYLDYDSALVEFEKARRLQPDNAQLLNSIAAVERRTGNLEAALADFKLALALDPRDYLKSMDVAITSSMLHQYDTAMAYVDHTLNLANWYDLPYVLKAWLNLLAQGDRDAARAVLNSAEGEADLSENSYYWWLTRILYDFETGLDKIAIGADSVQYYLYCGQMYRLMQDTSQMHAYYDSARELLEKRVLAQPEDARFRSRLGLAYAGLGRFDDAMREGQRALQLLPTWRDAFDAPFLIVNFAESCVMAHQYDEAVAQLEYLVSMPGFVTAEYLKLDPIWKPLHEHPRFQRICGEPSSI